MKKVKKGQKRQVSTNKEEAAPGVGTGSDSGIADIISVFLNCTIAKRSFHDHVNIVNIFKIKIQVFCFLTS